jgi:hypothetical protein
MFLGPILKNIQTVAIGAVHLALSLKAQVYARVTERSAAAVANHFHGINNDGLRGFDSHNVARSVNNPQVITKHRQGNNDLPSPAQAIRYIDLRTGGMIAIAEQNLEGTQP